MTGVASAEPSVRVAVPLPITLGGSTILATMLSFGGLSDGKEHIALRFDAPSESTVPLVRVHSECLTGDVFSSSRCDCGAQLRESLDLMSRLGGIVIYLRQEGRGIGLYNKLDAYALQDKSFDTFTANRVLGFDEDARNYRCAAEMLKALGVPRIRLLSNNPDKLAQLREHGVRVTETVFTGVYATDHNLGYLQAKVDRHGHRINFDREKQP